MTADHNFIDWTQAAGRELVGIAREVDPDGFDVLIDELLDAGRIALHALGREGLMMRALTMRLFHLGLRATPVGDMATPPLGAGDLLVVASGPGALETTGSLMRIARGAGARTILLTATPDAVLARNADRVLVLPARTMARPSSEPSLFTMGSAFEAMLLMFSEYLVARLARRMGESEDDMRARHTNLE